jgi:hypothetical protein
MELTMQMKMTGALVLMLLSACAAAAQASTENNTEVGNPAAVTAREALDAVLMGPVWLDGGESRTPVQLREVLRQPQVRGEDAMKLRSLTPEERLRMREQLRNPLPQANLK